MEAIGIYVPAGDFTDCYIARSAVFTDQVPVDRYDHFTGFAGWLLCKPAVQVLAH